MYSISLSFWTRILIMDFVLLLLLLILVKYIDSISAINTRLYEIINAFAYYSVVTSIYLMINISYINCNHAEFTNISILHFHVTSSYNIPIENYRVYSYMYHVTF